MITPSPRVEALLTALAADAPYRDALLGDLAEEFGTRVDAQGVAEARRWYRRQALRTAPHLLRQWGMRLGPIDVARLAVWTLLTEASMQLFWLMVRAAIVASFGVVPDSVGIVNAAWRSLLSSGAVSGSVVYPAAAIASLLAGFALARVERRAGLGTCVVVGAAVSLTFLVTASHGATSALWLGFALATIAGPGIVAGGASAALTRAGPRPGPS